MNDRNQRLAEGALYCLKEIGLAVVPMHSAKANGSCTCSNPKCRNVGKHPLETGYYDKALRTEEDVLSFFKENTKEVNLAALLDSKSDIIIVDVDPRNGGDTSLERLMVIAPEILNTLSVKSGGNGMHLYFKVDPKEKENLKKNISDYSGIDIKFADKELLILPGSIHKSGNEYAWNQKLPISNLPQSVLELMTSPKRQQARAKSQTVEIPEGQRNSTLYKAACKLVSKGLSEELINLAINDLNIKSCSPPLDLDEVGQIVSSARSKKSDLDDQYFVADNRIYHAPDGNLEKAYPLTNFVAYVSCQIEKNDGGVGPFPRIYKIDITHPELHPPYEYVEPQELDECRWLSRKDGALILLNSRSRDKLSIALRKLGNIENRETVYISVGWVERNRKLFYIGTNGAIGAEGYTNQYSASTDFGAPPFFEVGIPFSKDEIKTKWHIMQKLIAVAPDPISFALLATVFRAPLNHFFRGDFSVGLFGTTGAMKSTLAGLFLGFFGKEFNYNNLPESFASTVNALERKAFLCNSVVVVVDDYVPGETPDNVINYLVRGAGNQQGRGRMNADTSLKKTYHPRCIYLLTAEDLRLRPSLRARLVILNLEKGDLDKEVLTELQKISEDGELSRLMGNYIQWVINNEQSIRAGIKQRFLAHRKELNRSTEHNRTAPNLAQLILGLESFTAFALESELITPEQSEKWLERGKKAIEQLIEVQNEEQKNSDPISLFKQKLNEMLLGGLLHIAHPRPQDLGSLAKNIGYKVEGTWGHFPQGAKIGEFKNGELLLIPEIIESKVLSEIRNHGVRYSLSHRALGKMLKEKNFLYTEEGHIAIKRRIDGARPRCWVIPNWMSFLDIDLTEDALSAPKAPVAPQILPVSSLSLPQRGGSDVNKDLH
jgi:hypothetical protein